MDLYKVRDSLSMGIPLSEIKLRVTDYSRVSTDSKEQINSLKNQVSYFDEMIKKNPNWKYVKGYVDEGISGTTDIKRNNFMKMISDAKKGLFDLIITKEISRFSRNTLDSIKYTRELLEYGVCVLFVNDNINTIYPDSELRLTIMSSLAQDEIRRLSQRVKFGMHESLKKGGILGNNKLYGYKKKNNKFMIVKEEAKVVQTIFDMYTINNKSLCYITKFLNDNNISNRKWSVQTISRMIKNPKYKGCYCGNKSEVIDYITKKVKMKSKDEWLIYKDKRFPIIIKEEEWNIANAKINKKRITSTHYRYPLSGKIYCENDDYLFHRRKQCKNNDITWMCSNYLKNGKKKCDSANIRQSELYSIIKDILNEISFDLTNVTNILTKYYDNEKIIKQELKKSSTFEYVIKVLIEKITAKKIDDNTIELKIYLKKSNSKLSKTYSFKRGIHTPCTKKYDIYYNASLYY